MRITVTQTITSVLDENKHDWKRYDDQQIWIGKKNTTGSVINKEKPYRVIDLKKLVKRIGSKLNGKQTFGFISAAYYPTGEDPYIVPSEPTLLGTICSHCEQSNGEFHLQDCLDQRKTSLNLTVERVEEIIRTPLKLIPLATDDKKKNNSIKQKNNKMVNTKNDLIEKFNKVKGILKKDNNIQTPFQYNIWEPTIPGPKSGKIPKDSGQYPNSLNLKYIGIVGDSQLRKTSVRLSSNGIITFFRIPYEWVIQKFGKNTVIPFLNN